MANKSKMAQFGHRTRVEGDLAGYGWLIEKYRLRVPVPTRLAMIVKMRGRTEDGDRLLFGETYKPEDELYAQLVFALKYEGVDLHLLKTLWVTVGAKKITEIVRSEPTGQYARRIWFLYEWLTDRRLELDDTSSRDYFNLLNPKLQYPGPTRKSRRHGIRNNLPGTVDFCPLVRRTKAIDEFIGMKLRDRVTALAGKTSGELLRRASAFLLLEDSRASYAIEGERPPRNRAQHWAAAIGQAGRTPLSRSVFEQLQQTVLERPSFKLGYRIEEGFIGGRDPRSLDPIPHHISAKAADVERLMDGLLEASRLLEDRSVDPVVAAAILSFGFVFIHPFIDGNGRIHRWLIHHTLAAKGFAEATLAFPVSAVFLERLGDYRRVLEQYSIPRLEFIEWAPSPDHNVRIENETIDLYRYFDATAVTEFLYACVQHTIEVTLPNEINYLRRHDEMKAWLEAEYELPDNTTTLLISFLRQGAGVLSRRARTREFVFLSQEDIEKIEAAYSEIFR